MGGKSFKRAIAPNIPDTPSKKAKKHPVSFNASLTLGQFATTIIQQEYRGLVKQEKPVLADKDPENLHQMRVSSRRLYTALQVFDPAIALPKAARAKCVRTLTRVLGKLRDLDVQLQSLREDYLTQLDAAEQDQLSATLERLEQQRRKAFAGTYDILSRSLYRELKAGFEAWLAHPQLTPLADLPLRTILPDLLSPLLSHSLLHPGWLISAQDVTDENAVILHDLRKSCKHARYQAEFFTPFYGEAFKAWVKDLKGLQDSLGSLQDIEVLKQLLHHHRATAVKTPQLQQMIQDKQEALLATWETSRQPYLDADFRYRLHEMLLAPEQPEKT